MYVPEEIKSYMNGVHGTFLMVNDTPTFSDISFDVDSISKTVYYLRKCIQENRSASKMYVYCEKKNLVFYLDNEYTVGVMVSKNANIHLLHRIVDKILSHLKSPVTEDTEDDTTERVRSFFTT